MKNILWYLGVGYEPLVLTIENLIVGIVIDLVVAIAFYVLRSVALYTIAKRQNINKWKIIVDIYKIEENDNKIHIIYAQKQRDV